MKGFWYNLIGVKKYTDKIEELEESNIQLTSILEDREQYIVELENTNEELKSDIEKIKKKNFIENLKKYL